MRKIRSWQCSNLLVTFIRSGQCSNPLVTLIRSGQCSNPLVTLIRSGQCSNPLVTLIRGGQHSNPLVTLICDVAIAHGGWWRVSHLLVLRLCRYDLLQPELYLQDEKIFSLEIQVHYNFQLSCSHYIVPFSFIKQDSFNFINKLVSFVNMVCSIS